MVIISTEQESALRDDVRDSQYSRADNRADQRSYGYKRLMLGKETSFREPLFEHQLDYTICVYIRFEKEIYSLLRKLCSIS